MILVSACLTGQCCKYNGGHNYHQELMCYLEGRTYHTFCPEAAAGLSIPRAPAEISKGAVYNAAGEDLSAAFMQGAAACLEFCQQQHITTAILKERSPSCGVNYIYDGSFNGIIVPGQGLTTALLRQHGIAVYSEVEPDKWPML